MLNVGKSLSINKLVQTRWAFGVSGRRPLTTTFYFSVSGTIEGFKSRNEASWKFRNGALEIFDVHDALIWRSDHMFVHDGSLHVVLRSPINSAADFTIYECTPDGHRGYGGSAGLTTSEFLFPTDLQVTPSRVRKILLVGSCLTELYFKTFQSKYRDVAFDYILFNNAGDLPNAPPSSPTDYDFQYLQLPLRTVVTDRIITSGRLSDPSFLEQIYSDGCQIIDAMLDSGLGYTKAYGLLTFVSNFIVPQMDAAPDVAGRYGGTDLATLVRWLNDYLAEAVQRVANTFLCNVDAVAASIGKRYVLDDITGFFSHGSIFHQESVDLESQTRIEPVPPINSFYESKHQEFLAAIYAQAIATFRVAHQIDQVKAVIFDLDNTLWRGQIAEDYRPDRTPWPRGGWQLGIWEAIQHVRMRGILVAICSKNDVDVVSRHWENVVQPPVIKLEDFAIVKINWNDKEKNILEICQEFNIKPKSVLFVDDNPVERAAVQSLVPEIRSIGSNPYLTRRILLWAPEMQISRLTHESAQRESSVRGQLIREQSRAVLSREEFLKSLNCSVTFLELLGSDQSEFARVLELTNKTNQFNTTGKRWTHAELTAFLAGGASVVGFRARDKFSDYGLVGAVYVSDSSITQFVMSCRVFGMEIELAAVAHVVAHIRARGTSNSEVLAYVTTTADNSPCREVFTRAGFTELEPTAHQRVFGLNPQNTLPVPAHIEISVGVAAAAC